MKDILAKIKRRIHRTKTMSMREIRSDREQFIAMNKDARFAMDRKFEYICREDKYAQNGSFDNQYFIQDIWGARKVYENKPLLHYDVGSSVAGFIAHLLSMKQQVVLIDIREIANNLDTQFLRNGGGCYIPPIQRNAFRQYTAFKHSFTFCPV